MYVSTRRENDKGELRKLFVAGVVFITGMAAFIAVSIAIYNKAFTTFTTVTLMADRAGEQLPKYGDVRYNGVLVGQVRSITQTGDKAVIELGLNPSDARRLPAEIEASILPTTLFGQKYVALTPAGATGALGVRDGTVVPPERVYTSVELSQVLARLFPVLRAVRPSDLNATLTALASALNGRGNAVGESLAKLDSYLGVVNQHLPTLQSDLKLLAQVGQTYNLAAPDLVATLANLTVTSKTLRSQKAGVEGLFDDLTGVANLSSEVLEQNETNIIKATKSSVGIVNLLHKYGPEYYCLLAGAAKFKPNLLKTFEGGVVKQFIEVPTPQVRTYDERDVPRYNDTSGPICFGMPNNPPVPWPGHDYANGTDLDNAKGRGDSFFPGGAGRGSLESLYAGVIGGANQFSAMDRTSSPAGRQSTTAMLSQRSGRPADEIPTLSSLIYAPIAEEDGS